MLRAILGRPPLSFRFTSTGKKTLVLAVIIGAGALNTGVNLLYLVFALILGMIIASGVLSGLTLWDISARVRPPRRIFAGQSAHGTVSLRNRKKRFASFSVWVQDRDHQMLGEGSYFIAVPAGDRRSQNFTFSWPRRGRFEVGSMALLTRFPFGLFEKSVRSRSEETFLVYPRLFTVGAGAAIRAGAEGLKEKARRGLGSDLHNLREYRPGDNPKHVHWKSSARLAALMVREFNSEEDSGGRIVFDNRYGRGPDDRFETGVSTVASVVAYLIEEGLRLDYAHWGATERDCAGEEGLHRILDRLAVVKPIAADVAEGLEAPEILVSEGADQPVEGLILGFSEPRERAGGSNRIHLPDLARALGVRVELPS